MKLVSCVLLISFSCAVIADDPKRIIGGKDAPDGKYPYMVSLRDPDGYFCGGSIISSRWILTAAHCVLGFESQNVQVVAGTNLLEGGQPQVYQADYLVAHKDYNKPFFYNNDVGLIRVNKDIEFNDRVQSIKLSTTKDFGSVGTSVLVTGWGIYNKSTNQKPNKLQEITLKLIDLEICKEAWSPEGTRLSESQFCMSSNPKESVCFGDSGSPVVADGVQVGVVSISQLCLGRVPDVAAKVYYFLDWIAQEQAKF